MTYFLVKLLLKSKTQYYFRLLRQFAVARVLRNDKYAGKSVTCNLKTGYFFKTAFIGLSEIEKSSFTFSVNGI